MTCATAMLDLNCCKIGFLTERLWEKPTRDISGEALTSSFSTTKGAHNPRRTVWLGRNLAAASTQMNIDRGKRLWPKTLPRNLRADRATFPKRRNRVGQFVFMVRANNNRLLAKNSELRSHREKLWGESLKARKTDSTDYTKWLH